MLKINLQGGEMLKRWLEGIYMGSKKGNLSRVSFYTKSGKVSFYTRNEKMDKKEDYVKVEIEFFRKDFALVMKPKLIFTSKELSEEFKDYLWDKGIAIDLLIKKQKKEA